MTDWDLCYQPIEALVLDVEDERQLWVLDVGEHNCLGLILRGQPDLVLRLAEVPSGYCVGNGNPPPGKCIR